MKSFSICWECEKATNGKCSWSRNFVPVDGWDAEKTDNGYHVNKCPQFTKEKKKKENYNNEGVKMLAAAVLKTAGTDYSNALKPLSKEKLVDTIINRYDEIKNQTGKKKLIEKFFSNNIYSEIADIDGNYLIRAIKGTLGIDERVDKWLAEYTEGVLDGHNYEIRCEKCKHYERGWCNKRSINVNIKDYCVYAERSVAK